MGKYTFPIVLVIIVGGLIAVATFTKSDKTTKPQSSTSQTQQLLETTGPWEPQKEGLANRVAKLNFPPVGNESFHQHSMLQINVNGKTLPVPQNIGLGSIESPMHTHDERGIIHMEAGRSFPFTLGQFFTVWGVKFTDEQLGSYKNTAEQKLQVFVNGKEISKASDYQLKEKDKIIVGYGKVGEIPTEINTEFPKDL